MKSGNYAFIGRKQQEARFPPPVDHPYFSAACRMNGINYSTFMNGLKKAGITLNRKMLSEIAIADAAAFHRSGGEGQGCFIKKLRVAPEARDCLGRSCYFPPVTALTGSF